jgi:hypothetical protein
MERNEELFHFLGKIEARGKTYNIIHYSKPDEQLLKRLWKLKRKNGGMLQTIIYDPSKELEAIVVAGPRLGIYSWTAISNYGWGDDKMLNTYTKYGYRHMGFGSATKREAIKLCKSRSQKYSWCDGKTHMWHYND